MIGTSPESIDLAEDREKFKQILDQLGLKPQNETAEPEEAAEKAARIGYPILLRPSFVLGGRGMFIVYDEEELAEWSRKLCGRSASRCSWTSF